LGYLNMNMKNEAGGMERLELKRKLDRYNS